MQDNDKETIEEFIGDSLDKRYSESPDDYSLRLKGIIYTLYRDTILKDREIKLLEDQVFCYKGLVTNPRTLNTYMFDYKTLSKVKGMYARKIMKYEQIYGPIEMVDEDASKRLRNEIIFSIVDGLNGFLDILAILALIAFFMVVILILCDMGNVTIPFDMYVLALSLPCSAAFFHMLASHDRLKRIVTLILRKLNCI